MVVVEIKRSDTDVWLFNTTCATSNDALIRALVRVWNKRYAVQRLAAAVEQQQKTGEQRQEVAALAVQQ